MKMMVSDFSYFSFQLNNLIDITEVTIQLDRLLALNATN